MSAPASSRRILFASLIGTTIEFFDFYIYATAAVLVFPHLFFPASEPTAATLQSLATFALAFFARPLGSALFGHYGDRVGRKATLVAALLTMGISTVLIGLLPTHAQVGVLAPALLALCRFGKAPAWAGVGRRGAAGHRERAARQARLVRHVPAAGRAAGLPVLDRHLPAADAVPGRGPVPTMGLAHPVHRQRRAGAGRAVGAAADHRDARVPATLDRDERERLPMATLLRKHPGTLLVGTLSLMATFVLFYLMTVFALSWGTSQLGYGRQEFLLLQMAGVLCFAVTIPLSARYADRSGRRRAMILATLGIIAFGALFQPLFAAGSPWQVLLFLCLAQA